MDACYNGRKRLFCWSGGGLPGLDIHTGIWRALIELGIMPTANAGTSAGAIMAAFCSAGILQAEIEHTLRSLSDSDVRSERSCWKFRALWIDWFLDNAPIRALLEKLLPSRFMDLRMPLSVVATRVRDGRQTNFTERDTYAVRLWDAVLASMSISGVFPNVNINDEDYADGGVRANLPLPENWRKFDEIYLLVASRPVNYGANTLEVKRSTLHGILARLMLNLDWYALDQIEDTIALLNSEHARLRGPAFHIIWPTCGREAGALRFQHDFIDQAYQQTMTQLAVGKAK